MATDLSLLVPALLVLALLASMTPRGAGLSRTLLACGAGAGAVLCFKELPSSAIFFTVPFGPDMDGTYFMLDANASWLLGLGFAAAVLVFIAGPNTASPRGWCFGAAMSLLGAYGVAGLQDGMSFLVAYEVMSLGGAVMIMADRRTEEAGPAGALHAGHSGSRRGRPAGRLSCPYRTERLSRFCGIYGGNAGTPGRYSRVRRLLAPDRLRRQNRHHPLLRMVSRCLWRRQWRHGRIDVGHHSQRGFLRARTRPADVVPSKSRNDAHVRHSSRCHWRYQRGAECALRVSAGKLAPALWHSPPPRTVRWRSPCWALR